MSENDEKNQCKICKLQLKNSMTLNRHMLSHQIGKNSFNINLH